MQKQLAITFVFGVLSFAAARPGVDILGICYDIKGTKISRAPCVISPGYGAGAQYVTYAFNGQEYFVEYPNTRPNLPPTLNGKTAVEYKRDASFLAILKGRPIEGETYINCIKTKDGKTDICALYPD
ncbi:hypothetical protein D3875_16950 [Deinococcus cavernae]|uniref:Uncharacterized protein n=1 Tax=Deinococcus cavernae TaxID=2320857 RepID=A0A418VA84_9DEIO|nr:hypothetical protein [Deinococcus cavernae]RJF72977.1 hypothetical protein D3875_16950 [Deinococcus cavernae]